MWASILFFSESSTNLHLLLHCLLFPAEEMSKRGDILAHQAFLLLRVIPFDITDLRYQILCIFRRTPYQMKSRAYLIQVSEEH